jgi:Ca2+-binding RTX toxin-like protein
VYVSGSTLVVQAASGKKNVLSVSQFGSSFTVGDGGDAVAPGTGCSALDARTARCSLTGVAAVRIWTFDLDDVVRKDASGAGWIDGGGGDDAIEAGRTSVYNEVFGGPGRDTLTGGPDVDYLDGGPGADVLAGAGGVDRATYRDRFAPVTVTLDGIANDGEAGENDNIRLDVEDVIGGARADTLTGSATANHLYGLEGADVLNGLAGDDTLTGGLGADTANGGDGQDTFDQAGPGGDGGDLFNGGAGSADRVSYARRHVAVHVDLDGTADDGYGAEGDNLQSDVEQVIGGSADDTLTGSAGANLLLGGSGNDTLSGLAGPDTLSGDAGDDSLLGGTGDDTLTGVDGVLGNDELDGQADGDACSLDHFDAWANCEALAILP